MRISNKYQIIILDNIFLNIEEKIFYNVLGVL